MTTLPAKATWDEINAWMAEGAKQQKEYLDKHFEKYYIRMKLRETVKIIEDILK